MSDVNFNDSAENIESSLNYSYLLNFWHVSKLNKEYEFIKRHGLHPNLVTTDSSNINDMKVAEGNGISTAFYTAFRIFLKGFFYGAEAFKSRDQDEWKITYTDKQSHLDNLNYLIYKFNENNLPENVIRSASRRYGLRSNESFAIKLFEKDQIHAKLVLDDFNSMHTKASTDIDSQIEIELLALTTKIAKISEIENPFTKKKTKTKESSINHDRSPGWMHIEAPWPATVIPPILENPTLEELIPIWNQIKEGIGMFPNRTKFSYLLNFAKQGSTNTVINNIQDIENNYLIFMNLTNQMAA